MDDQLYKDTSHESVLKLLNTPDVIKVLRRHSSKLIEYITKPPVLKILISYSLEKPKQKMDPSYMLLSNNSTILLSEKTQELQAKLLNSPQLNEKMNNFLTLKFDEKSKLYYIGHFKRILESFLLFSNGKYYSSLPVTFFNTITSDDNICDFYEVIILILKESNAFMSKDDIDNFAKKAYKLKYPNKKAIKFTIASNVISILEQTIDECSHFASLLSENAIVSFLKLAAKIRKRKRTLEKDYIAAQIYKIIEISYRSNTALVDLLLMNVDTVTGINTSKIWLSDIAALRAFGGALIDQFIPALFEAHPDSRSCIEIVQAFQSLPPRGRMLFYQSYVVEKRGFVELVARALGGDTGTLCGWLWELAGTIQGDIEEGARADILAIPGIKAWEKFAPMLVEHNRVIVESVKDAFALI